MLWSAKTAIETLSLDEFKQGLADGLLLVVDVREAPEFAAGHIPGAVSAPLSTFDPAALPRPQGQQIVLSCQGGARSLKALGQAAAAGRSDIHAHFGGGFTAWRGAGEPVEA